MIECLALFDDNIDFKLTGVIENSYTKNKLIKRVIIGTIEFKHDPNTKPNINYLNTHKSLRRERLYFNPNKDGKTLNFEIEDRYVGLFEKITEFFKYNFNKLGKLGE